MLDLLLRFTSTYLQHFKPLKKLGSGAFGQIHLVQRRDSKHLYVTKRVKKTRVTNSVIVPEGAASTRGSCLASSVDRSRVGDSSRGEGTPLPAEIANLMALEHANIIQLEGYLETTRTWTLLLQYNPGYGDVRRWVRRRERLASSNDHRRPLLVQLVGILPQLRGLSPYPTRIS